MARREAMPLLLSHWGRAGAHRRPLLQRRVIALKKRPRSRTRAHARPDERAGRCRDRKGGELSRFRGAGDQRYRAGTRPVPSHPFRGVLDRNTRCSVGKGLQGAFEQQSRTRMRSSPGNCPPCSMVVTRRMRPLTQPFCGARGENRLRLSGTKGTALSWLPKSNPSISPNAPHLLHCRIIRAWRGVAPSTLSKPLSLPLTLWALPAAQDL